LLVTIIIEHYRLSLDVVTRDAESDDDKHKINGAANLQREHLRETAE